MHKKTLFSRAGRLAVAVSGALATAGAALPANASTLRIAMTAADIPLTLGQPDQGYEGNRFTGIPLYDALVEWDLSQGEKPSGLVRGWRPSGTSIRRIPAAGFSPCVRGEVS